jgi:hypothetical protein
MPSRAAATRTLRALKRFRAAGARGLPMTRWSSAVASARVELRRVEQTVDLPFNAAASLRLDRAVLHLDNLLAAWPGHVVGELQ